MIAFLILLFLIPVTISTPIPTQIPIDNFNCDQIVYSTNWTLAQLRNITAKCSNGG